MVSGLWTNWPAVDAHPGYQPVADVLGQSVDGGTTGVLLADLDIDELWAAAVRSALLVNAESPLSPE
jgi:hypothetical protein